MCTRTSFCVAGRIIRFNGFTSFSMDLKTAVSRAEHGQVLQLCMVTLWNRPVCKGSGSVNEGSNSRFPVPERPGHGANLTESTSDRHCRVSAFCTTQGGCTVARSSNRKVRLTSA